MWSFVMQMCLPGTLASWADWEKLLALRAQRVSVKPWKASGKQGEVGGHCSLTEELLRS